MNNKTKGQLPCLTLLICSIILSGNGVASEGIDALRKTNNAQATTEFTDQSNSVVALHNGLLISESENPEHSKAAILAYANKREEQDGGCRWRDKPSRGRHNCRMPDRRPRYT